MTSLYRNEPLPSASTLPQGPDGHNHEIYLPDDGLVAAINVTLMLGRPLFLTGEPGCGKTRLAYHLADELRLGRPLRFDTKSDSSARDLFYNYDAIAHFHAAQVLEEPNPLPHLRLNALGLAVLRTHSAQTLEALQLEPLLGNGEMDGSTTVDSTPRQSLVLVDEIDKAPRDFPNDILNEVENLCFAIPELGHRSEPIAVASDPKLRPILVLTSNSEKNLPDAFLRRCIYYDIPFPDSERLWRIVDAHLAETAERRRAQFNEALGFFEKLREIETGLKKPPGTAELLDWLRVLDRTLTGAQSLVSQTDRVLGSLGALIKNQEDRQVAMDLWRQRSQQTPPTAM